MTKVEEAAREALRIHESNSAKILVPYTFHVGFSAGASWQQEQMKERIEKLEAKAKAWDYYYKCVEDTAKGKGQNKSFGGIAHALRLQVEMDQALRLNS